MSVQNTKESAPVTERKTPVVFLDRDGTINVDSGYVVKPADVVLIPGVAKALGSLKRGGAKLVVVSNQSAIGRGMASHDDVIACNQEVQRQLEAIDGDAAIDLMLYAPDHPERATARRKPGTGMLADVEEYFSFAPEQSWVIGDKVSDMEFGANAGLSPSNCLLVLTGEGREAVSILRERGDSGDGKEIQFPTFSSLVEAAAHILSGPNTK